MKDINYIKLFRPLCLLLFISFLIFVFIPTIALSEDSGKNPESLWWKILSFTAKGADQSTAPAPDLIPYDWIKEKANSLIVKPTQAGFDGIPVKSNNFSYEYNQKSQLLQKLGRNKTMKSLKHDRSVNYPTTMDDIEALPMSDVPIGGSDVAAPGNWKPIKAPRQSFSEVAAPIVKKHFDTSRHTGKIKTLDTLQAIQHLIDCQAQGKSAEDCAKGYGLSFAMSKAITETLKVVGQQAGLHLAGDAALGQAVVGGFATVASLAYADYLAILEIQKLVRIRSQKWDDDIKNKNQAKNNRASNRDHWNGGEVKLKEILKTFRWQFNSGMEAAGDELFDAWGDMKHSLIELKQKRKTLVQELKITLDSEEFSRKLESHCKQIDFSQNDEMVKLVTEIQQQIKKIVELLFKAEEALSTCSSEEEADSIRQKHELMINYSQDVSENLKKFGEMTELEEKERLKVLETRKEELIAEAEKAENLKEAYDNFKATYDESILYSWRTSVALKDYQSLYNGFRIRSRRLTTFLTQRAGEALYGERLATAQSLITELKGHVKKFKPRRMPYDDINSYDKELKSTIFDLKSKENTGKKLTKKIESWIASLKKIKVSCPTEKDLSKEKNEQKLKIQKTRISKVLQDLKKCAGIVIPDFRNMSLSVAESRIRNLKLKSNPEQLKDINLDQKKNFIIIRQKPDPKAKVSPETEVWLLYWGEYDKESACMKLRKTFAGAIADKNTKEARKVLTKLRSRHCEDLSSLEATLDRSENEHNKKTKIYLPDLNGFPLDKALKKLKDLGFKNNRSHDLKEKKTIQYDLNNKVKSQNPSGKGYYPEGAVVELTYWSFDFRLAESGTDCASVRGSQPKWNSQKNDVECLCSAGRVKITSKKLGSYCAACSDLKLFFDREIERQDLIRARKILAKVKGICSWEKNASAAISASENNNQADDNCRRRLSGSKPVFSPDGSYQCQCPDKTVATTTKKQGRSCVPCGAMEKFFHKAVKSNDINRSRKILGLSSYCSWASNGQTVISRWENNIAQAEKQKQQAANRNRCQNLVNQAERACGSKQWLILQGLYAQINQTPGCKINPAFMNQCNASQIAQLNNNFNHSTPSTPDNGLKNDRNKSEKVPQRPEPVRNNQTESIEQYCMRRHCSWCFRVTKVSTTDNGQTRTNCTEVSYWCPFLKGSRQEAFNHVEKNKRNIIANGREMGTVFHRFTNELVRGPSKKAIMSTEYPRPNNKCKDHRYN